jgi:tetratricopeptide (TPR) repeat protein/regulation of enolase protein 1 (concanavalin A-like superfamily)
MCMLDKKVDETQRWLLDFEDGARRHHDLRALSEMRNEMGILHYEQGKLGQALSEHEQAVDLSRRIGDDRLVAWSLSQLFVTHLAHGALNEAEACIRRWFETTETLGSRIHRALAYGGVGWLSLSQGRLEEAIPPLQQAIELESEGMGSAYEALLTLLLARAHLALGHRRQAREQFHTPAVPSDPTGSDPWLVPVLSTLEQACETPEEFCLLCRRYRAQCPEIQNAPYAQLVGWRLEPADVQADPGTGPDLPLRPSDWDWVDPYGDCSYSADVDLEIHAANGRDMWHVNWSAPRLLRQISGGFSVETTCGPAVDDRPAIGGLLLWRDERNYLHLDRGAYGEREITLTGCVGNEDVVIGRGWLREASGQIYLRLERLGDVVYAYCSADGERWFTVGHVTFPVEDPVQVGLHAIGAIDRTVYRGAYPEGTAIRFASFRLWEPAR